MLLTITYSGSNTTDIGYLLHKNPYRPQSFKLSFGRAHVFYPEVSDEKTTCALLLEIDPVELARGKAGSRDGGLFDYVNDRPYVCSSFMSNAVSRVFGSALSGVCSERPELAQSPLDLCARLYCLPCKAGEGMVREMFEPLGYTVEVKGSVLDEKFPQWGESAYFDVTLAGKVKLCELLDHLYLLMPVFDRQKHYYMSDDEIDKLLAHGEGWLNSHPTRDRIINRYFAAKKSLAGVAKSRLDELAARGDGAEGEGDEREGAEPTIARESKVRLDDLRLEAVKNAVVACGASSVIDLGCGEGKLTALLSGEKRITRMTAVDVSVRALERAEARLLSPRVPESKKAKIALLHGSLLYRDERFNGFDCACLVEVIEHIDPTRFKEFERTVFEFAKPKTVIVTTPNVEYNSIYGMAEGNLRHGDHRFEWTRGQFAAWAHGVCERFGYTVELGGIGDSDPELGAPTQMGVFTLCA